MQSDSMDGRMRKYPCPDCKMCQGCSESRCRACRCDPRAKSGKKLSIAEQIALYEKLNPTLTSRERS